MSEFSRREMLSAAAAGGMAVAATSTDGLAEGQPPFGPTPPVLAGAQLPSFRFQLGALAPKSWDGGWAKRSAGVGKARRRADFARSRRAARAALARQCRGMGLCDQGTMPGHHHQPERPVA